MEVVIEGQVEGIRITIMIKKTRNEDKDCRAGHDKEEEGDEEGPTDGDETEYHEHAGRSGGNAAHLLDDWP
jgi:hypothetical protein